MKKIGFFVLCFAVLFLASSVFAREPSAGVCKILENPDELPAYCAGGALVIEEAVNSFNVLEAPVEVDINAFIRQQIALSSIGLRGDANQFVVHFFAEEGIYKLKANGKEIVVDFQLPKDSYSLTTALLVITLIAILAVIVISRNNRGPTLLLTLLLLLTIAIVLILSLILMDL